MATDPRLIKRSVRPGKQFMFLRVGAALQRLAPYERVLDIACGPMALVPAFAGKDYIGIDAYEPNLRAGRERHPGTPAICTRIEDLGPKMLGDLVLCLQCVGFNKEFNKRHTIPCVHKLADAVRPGGTLIMNVNADLEPRFGDIESILAGKFESLEVVRYGRFREKRPLPLCLALGYLMLYLPFIAPSSSNPERLYICHRRR